MGSKRKCINYGRVMKQQFIGLKQCKCGISWRKDIDYFLNKLQICCSSLKTYSRNKVFSESGFVNKRGLQPIGYIQLIRVANVL